MEELKRIYLGFNNRNKLNPEMYGKVIKDIILTYKAYDDDRNYLIIIFTDNTYLAFGIEHGEKDDIEYNWIDEAYMQNQKDWVKLAGEHMYQDHKTGEYKLYDYMQVLVDAGFYNLTVDDIQKVKEKREKEREDREYQYYLHLKEKYENK